MLIDKIKSGSYNPYDVLSGYSTFLLSKGAISSLTLKQRVVTAKNLLEYFDVATSPRIFKLKEAAQSNSKKKQALSKEDIIAEGALQRFRI